MARRVRLSVAVAACVLLTCLSAGEPMAFASGSPDQGTPTPTPSTSTSYAPTHSPFSLTISPTRLNITAADMGEVHQILAVNRGDTPLHVTVEERNFVANRDGSLQFKADAPYSASSWVSVEPTSFTLAPGQSTEVDATITLPPGPEPGDHAVAIVFLVPAGQSKANIKINRGVATPVFITVAGPSTDTVTLSGFHGPGFAIGGPIPVSTTVNDTGSVHRDFRGASDLLMTGGGQDRTVFPDFTVMRGSSRVITTTWHPPFMCICNPQVSVVNADGTVHTLTYRVIVFPLIQALVLVGGVLLLVLLVVLGRRRSQGNAARAAAALATPGSRADG